MRSADAVLHSKRALIVNYHYCSPEHDATLGLKGITSQAFDRQLSELSNCLDPLAVRDLPFEISEKSGKTGYLISFDDGLRDVLSHALPIVRKYSAAAIIFCCALPYLEGRVLNVQKSHLLQWRWGWRDFRAKFLCALSDDPEGSQRDNTDHLHLDRMYRYDDEDVASFKRLLNVELPYSVVDRVLDRLFEDEFGPQRDIVDRIYLSTDDIRRCADDGMCIGLHTYSHCMLSRLSKQEQATELDASLALFRDRLGLEIGAISYPYGIAGSWNDDTKELAVQRGLHAGYTLGREIYAADVHIDPMEIPRYDVNDVFHRDGTIKIEL